MTTAVQTTIQPSSGYPPQHGYPQHQAYPQQQPHAIFIQAPPSSGSDPSKNERYNRKAAFVTGILQITAGALLVLFGIIVLVLRSWYRLSWGIWGSLCFYVVTSILGVVSKNQRKCVIMAYMVMNIISAVCAGSQMIYDARAASTSRYHGEFFCDLLDYDLIYHHGRLYETCGTVNAIIAMHSLCALVALDEMIIAIVASAFCCAGCCGTTSTPTQSTIVKIVTYGQPAPNPQVTVVSSGGFPPATTYPQASGGAYPDQPHNNTQQQSTYEEPKKEAT